MPRRWGASRLKQDGGGGGSGSRGCPNRSRRVPDARHMRSCDLNATLERIRHRTLTGGFEPHHEAPEKNVVRQRARIMYKESLSMVALVLGQVYSLSL